MTYYAYILYSINLAGFYKGHTNDIEMRLGRHNSYQETYTKKGVPWKLLWYSEKHSKSGAYSLERKLKNLSRNATVKFMLKYEEGIVGPDELLWIKQFSRC